VTIPLECTPGEKFVKRLPHAWTVETVLSLELPELRHWLHHRNALPSIPAKTSDEEEHEILLAAAHVWLNVETAQQAAAQPKVPHDKRRLWICECGVQFFSAQRFADHRGIMDTFGHSEVTTSDGKSSPKAALGAGAIADPDGIREVKRPAAVPSAEVHSPKRLAQTKESSAAAATPAILAPTFTSWYLHMILEGGKAGDRGGCAARMQNGFAGAHVAPICADLSSFFVLAPCMVRVWYWSALG
jgi:hypothetical protein